MRLSSAFAARCRGWDRWVEVLFLDSYRLTQRTLRVLDEEEKSIIELSRAVSRPAKVVRLAFAFANGGTGHHLPDRERGARRQRAPEHRDTHRRR